MSPQSALRTLLVAGCLLSLPAACSRREPPAGAGTGSSPAQRTLPPPPPSPPLPTAPALAPPVAAEHPAAPPPRAQAPAPPTVVTAAHTAVNAVANTTLPGARTAAAPTTNAVATTTQPGAGTTAAPARPVPVPTETPPQEASPPGVAPAPPAEPAAQNSSPAQTAAADAPSRVSTLTPTRIVRIRVRSRQPADTFLPRAVKHLYIGRHDLRLLPGELLELPYAEVGEAPLTLRIQHYEPVNAVLKASTHAPDGICEVVFEVVPHPATLQVLAEPPHAEIWQVAGNHLVRNVGPATRPLWIPPLVEHQLALRTPGYQPQSITIPAPEPAALLPDRTVRCLPLPLTARPGQSCRIALNADCDLLLAWIPGGEMVLQDPRFAGAPPDIRTERIPRGFWMAKTETTRAQWRAVMKTGEPADSEGDRLPQTGVAWEEALRFCEVLTRLIPYGTVRLPTEAEWQHAAAAGRDDPYGRIAAAGVLHSGNSDGRPGPVDKGLPNPWNLYHLPGNVREWCADPFAPYRASGQVSAPLRRVVRGGSYLIQLLDCQIAIRDAEPPRTQAPDLGFRVVIVPDPLRPLYAPVSTR